MGSHYDAIIIGAGHNGLVTACYLARAGKKVLMLERRPLVGGACVTEEVFPGFKVSTAAYVISLFRPEIIRDLRLRDYGFTVLERDPSSFTPFPDGRALLLGPDPELNARSPPSSIPRWPRPKNISCRSSSSTRPISFGTPPGISCETVSPIAVSIC